MSTRNATWFSRSSRNFRGLETRGKSHKTEDARHETGDGRPDHEARAARLRSCGSGREKPRGSPACASPSRGSRAKRLRHFALPSTSACASSSAMARSRRVPVLPVPLRPLPAARPAGPRCYPQPAGSRRSPSWPEGLSGGRSAVRRFGVAHRDLGGPDGHRCPAPESEPPTGAPGRSRCSRRPFRSSDPAVSRRPVGGPEGPSVGSLSGPEPVEEAGR